MDLERAWKRLQTNSEAKFKNYFRPHYRSWELGLSAHLDALKADLLGGRYQPEASTKVWPAKPKGTLRCYSLLTVRDQIVYQALGDRVAEVLRPHLTELYEIEIFGNRLTQHDSPFAFEKWRDGYQAALDAARAHHAAGYRWSTLMDLAGCYDVVDHGIVFSELEELGLEAGLVSLLGTCLHRWRADLPSPTGHVPRTGLPQGPQASAVLAEVLLRRLHDVDLGPDVRLVRYADDTHLFARSRQALLSAMAWLDVQIKRLGQVPQSGKLEVGELTDPLQNFSATSMQPGRSGSLTAEDHEASNREALRILEKEKIEDGSRFKFILGATRPDKALVKALLKHLGVSHGFAKSACAAMSRATRWPRSFERRLAELLESYAGVPDVVADLLLVASARGVPLQDHSLLKAIESLSAASVRDAAVGYALFELAVTTGMWSVEQVALELRRPASPWESSSRLHAFRGHPGLVTGEVRAVAAEGLATEDWDVALACAELLRPELDEEVRSGGPGSAATRRREWNLAARRALSSGPELLEAVEVQLGLPAASVDVLLGGRRPADVIRVVLELQCRGNTAEWFGLAEELLVALVDSGSSLGLQAGRPFTAVESTLEKMRADVREDGSTSRRRWWERDALRREIAKHFPVGP